LDERAEKTLGEMIESIGFMAITGEDGLFVADRRLFALHNLPRKPFGTGDVVRDWLVACQEAVLVVYNQSKTAQMIDFDSSSLVMRYLWPYRTTLGNRNMFGKSPEEHGFKWYEYMQFIRERYTASLLIPFAFVATHNHFVLDRGGKVFKQSAPVIKLAVGTSEDEHLKLLGLLNSSTGCFWMKSIFHNKGSTVDQRGARQRTAAFEDFYEYTSTGLLKFPLPAEKPVDLPRRLDTLAQEYRQLLPSAMMKRGTPTRRGLDDARTKAE